MKKQRKLEFEFWPWPFCCCLLLPLTAPQMLIIIFLSFIFGQGKWQSGVKAKNKQPSEYPSPRLPANGISEEDCLFPFRQAFRDYFNPFLVANSIYQNKCWLVASSFRSLTAWRGKSLKNNWVCFYCMFPCPGDFGDVIRKHSSDGAERRNQCFTKPAIPLSSTLVPRNQGSCSCHKWGCFRFNLAIIRR